MGAVFKYARLALAIPLFFAAAALFGVLAIASFISPSLGSRISGPIIDVVDGISSVYMAVFPFGCGGYRDK